MCVDAILQCVEMVPDVVAAHRLDHARSQGGWGYFLKPGVGDDHHRDCDGVCDGCCTVSYKWMGSDWNVS